jgi:hypothetical protein
MFISVTTASCKSAKAKIKVSWSSAVHTEELTHVAVLIYLSIAQVIAVSMSEEGGRRAQMINWLQLKLRAKAIYSFVFLRRFNDENLREQDETCNALSSHQSDDEPSKSTTLSRATCHYGS